MASGGRPKTDAADYKVVHVRMPPDMVQKLHERAARSGRPINTELLRIIDRVLEMDERQSAQDSASASQNAQDVVTASPLEGYEELKQEILLGGTTALQAFSRAVESGTVRVRTGKVSPVRNSEPRTTPSTPRAPVRALSNDEISDVLERSARGDQPVEIAQVHGRHPVTVRAIISGRITAKQN
jgi:hypothetical protein